MISFLVISWGFVAAIFIARALTASLHDALPLPGCHERIFVVGPALTKNTAIWFVLAAKHGGQVALVSDVRFFYIQLSSVVLRAPNL